MPELRGLADAAPDALVRQFAAGGHPDWLEPTDGAGPLMLYRVTNPD